MNKDRKNIILGNKISEIYDWNLGGYKQKVLIEGKEGMERVLERLDVLSQKLLGDEVEGNEGDL